MTHNISIFDIFYYNIPQDRLWILRDKSMDFNIVTNNFDHPSFVRLTVAQATHLFNKWNYEFIVYLTNITNREQMFDSQITRDKNSRVIICDNYTFCKEPNFSEQVNTGIVAKESQKVIVKNYIKIGEENEVAILVCDDSIDVNAVSMKDITDNNKHLRSTMYGTMLVILQNSKNSKVLKNRYGGTC